MHVKVLLNDLSAPGALTQEVVIYCGAGHQILQWLGYAACAQLAQRQCKAAGHYVPQSVLDKEGRVLDVDLVLSEVVLAGDASLTVEYGPGPQAWRVRWEGRPATPPFEWDDEAGAEVVAPHDAWLHGLDPAKEGLGALQDAEQRSVNPAAAAEDLAAIKQLFVDHAGLLQMLLLAHTCDPSTPASALCRMSLPQFRSMLAAVHGTPGRMATETLDALFAAVAAAEATLARRGGGTAGSGGSWLELPDLMVALVHVAHARFLAEGASFSLPADAPLSLQLSAMLSDCLLPRLVAALRKQLERLDGANTSGASLLLRKGRKLTEQALERCQVKRRHTGAQHAPLAVELAAVASHLEAWQGTWLQENGALLVWALQGTSDPSRFALLPQPLEVGYGTFEALLLGQAYCQYLDRAALRRQVEPWEDFLADHLGAAYRKSGVLVLMEGPNPAATAAASTAGSRPGTQSSLGAPPQEAAKAAAGPAAEDASGAAPSGSEAAGGAEGLAGPAAAEAAGGGGEGEQR